MKTSSSLFLLGLVFFLPVAVIYAYFTHAVMGTWEPVGVVGVTLLGVMTGMIGLYLRATIRKLDTDPADNADGQIAQGAGEYGFFAPYSWAPLWLGGAAFLVFLGLALSRFSGFWVFVIGVVAGVVALVLWTFEYYGPEDTL